MTGNYQTRVSVPRYRCFSLSDFHDFNYCTFRFFVKHHLGKKYELEEGSPNQALGSLLDLTVKKIHQNKLYHQPVEFLVNIVKNSEVHMREKAQKDGPYSYFGPQIKFLTPELVEKTQAVLKNYLNDLNGHWQNSVSDKTFWEYDLVGSDGELIRLWGGPDLIEMGKDNLPEIIDFKYFEDQDKGRSYLDMDLMPKLYFLLTIPELKRLGFNKARFKIRFWQDAKDESVYEEFNIGQEDSFMSYFKSKAEAILRTTEISFCEKDYCSVCQSPNRIAWQKEIEAKFLGQINLS